MASLTRSTSKYPRVQSNAGVAARKTWKLFRFVLALTGNLLIHGQSFASNQVSPNLRDTSQISFVSRLISPDSFHFKIGASRLAANFIIRGIPYLALEDCEANALQIYNAMTWSHAKTITVPPRIPLCDKLHNYYTPDLETFYFLTEDSEIVRLSAGDSTQAVIDLSERQFPGSYGLDQFLSDHNLPYLTSDSAILFQLEFGKKVRTRKTRKRPYPTAVVRWPDKRVTYVGDRNLAHWSEGHYGLMDIRAQYYSDSTILYTQAFNAEIRRFHFRTNSSEIFVCKSLFDTVHTSPIPLRSTRDEKWNHLKSSGYYGRLLYNPWKNCYYRFYFHPIPEKLPSGDFSAISDRRISLLVLSDNFQLIGERLLPESCYFIFFASSLPNGLVIHEGPITGLAENGLKILEIRH